MAYGSIPGTFGEGANTDDRAPEVPFQTPNNPMAGVSPTGADTNYGRDVSTVDRKFSVEVIPNDLTYSPFGEGTCQNLWGVMGTKK